MLTMRFILSIFSVGTIAFGAGVVSSQNYPNKPVRIVTSEVGGSNDLVARLIMPRISASLGQPVIIDNRPTIVTPEIVAKAPPDGYTMLVSGTLLWTEPLLRSNMPYDPVGDFSPITLINRSPNVLVVHPSIAATSVKELIALAKAKPGALNYGSGPTGGLNHLAGELFKSMAGVNIVRIPYKGTGPALNDLIAGQLQLMFPLSGSSAPHIKSGKLRALAVTSPTPSTLVPGLPTVAASGLPGYESTSYIGIFAAGKTPVVIINRLNQEIVRVLDRPDVKETFFNNGSEVVGSSPKQFSDVINADMARMGKVIKDAGIKAE